MLLPSLQLLPLGLRFARNWEEAMWRCRARARWHVRVFSRLRSMCLFPCYIFALCQVFWFRGRWRPHHTEDDAAIHLAAGGRSDPPVW